MGWVSETVADVVWKLGQRAVTYSRKRSARQHLEELARWDLSHVGITAAHPTCVVCGLTAESLGPCPGPRSAQDARAQLRALQSLPPTRVNSKPRR